MNTLYPAVAERAVYRCEYCHAPERVFNFPFEVEHIFPQARGGGVDAEGAEIFGITSVSRATVARLQMNRPRYIIARRRWIQLGLFP